MQNIDAKEFEANFEISLEINRQALFPGTDLTIEFIAVLEDSRCPVGVDCLWEGNAKVQIKISDSENNAQIFELNTALEPQNLLYKAYQVRLAQLEPMPRANFNIIPEDYRAIFLLTESESEA